MNKQETGSLTAKGGFINEAEICRKFVNYKVDNDARSWLATMGYDVHKIQKLYAHHIPVRINLKKALSLGVSLEKYNETIQHKKADIQLKIEIVLNDVLYVENLSLKKANQSAGFNQVDKRAVKSYQMMWGFDDELSKWLRVFTGDILPEQVLSAENLQVTRDKRRLFLDEFPRDKLQMVTSFFTKNKILVVTDILRGRGGLSVEWLLVTRKNKDYSLDWILKDINSVINFYAQGDVELTPRGSLKIGRVTMQRKGGTPDPTSLQFKINPLQLFGI